MVLLSVLSVLNTAFEADLVFVDPAKGRLVPVKWLEGVLNPVVGIGLLFYWAATFSRNQEMLTEPHPLCYGCSTLLYGAAIVGISYRWGYSSWRGERVRHDFEAQVIENLQPLSYDLTRSKGRIDFNVENGHG